jgi:hypothetical protein
MTGSGFLLKACCPCKVICVGREYPKIVRPVMSRVVVKVVDYFIILKISSKQHFSEKSVLRDIANWFPASRM